MTSSQPSPASAGLRARRRGSFRAVAVALLVFLTSLGTLLGASPATANSAAGIAANSWIVSDLAADVANGGYNVLTEAESIKYGAATASSTAAAGLAAKPKPSGKLGLIVNTAAMLGGLVFMWPGGDDAPAVPSVDAAPATDPNTVNNGTAACGYGSGTVVVLGCDASVLTFKATGPGTGNIVLYQTTAPTGWTSNSSCNGCSRTWTRVTAKRSYDVYQGSKNLATDVLVGRLWVSGTGTDQWNFSTTAPADPATVPRYIDSTYTCKKPDGAGGFTADTYTNRVGPFTFDPAQPSELPEVPDLECPAGYFLDSGKRELSTEGSSERVPLDVPYSAPSWVGEQATRFPECLPVGNLNCLLKLFRKATANDPELDCHSMAPGSGNACRDWATDPNKADKYECRFGANVVALKQCEPYKQTFSTGVTTPTPETETPTPVTGADPTPDSTPNLGDCVPSWSLELLNPWWLFKGVACALSWAFVPETALSVRVDKIKTALMLKAPFTWFAGFVSVPVAIPDNGCPDWRVKVGGLDKNVVCGHDSTEFIRAARPVLLVFMGSLALWPLIRSTAYAAFPIIKPSPGMLR